MQPRSNTPFGFSAARSGFRTTSVLDPREASWSAVALYSFSHDRIQPAGSKHEDDAGWQKVSRYVHLSPVRITGVALDQRQSFVLALAAVAGQSR